MFNIFKNMVNHDWFKEANIVQKILCLIGLPPILICSYIIGVVEGIIYAIRDLL